MNEILKILIGTTSISTVIIFLGKYILNFLRDIGAEKYKNELSQQTIKFKSGLDKEFEKFKISYSNVFVEQIVIIKKTYKKLIQAERPLEYLLRPIKFGVIRPDEEVAKEVVEKANKLFEFFDENELIFNKKSSETFTEIRKKYLEVWSTYSKKQFLGERIPADVFKELNTEMQVAYEQKLKVEMQKLKSLLRDEFRVQLGLLDEIDKKDN
jgi:hypothetical protein